MVTEETLSQDKVQRFHGSCSRLWVKVSERRKTLNRILDNAE